MESIDQHDVERFAELLQADSFKTRMTQDGKYYAETERCIIEFFVDPRGGVDITIRDPHSANEAYRVFVLRHMRNARDIPGMNRRSIENMAGVFNCYFSDLLRGDFSKLGEYRTTKALLNSFIPKIISLEEDDLIRVKFKNFDESWLADLKSKLKIV
jgi:hypothetical protein